MSDGDDSSEQAHLALLVAKHQEQAQLFYSRVQVLLVVYGFLFAAAGVVVGGDKLRSDVSYVLLILLMFIGAAFSFTWWVVIKESNDWIRFWEAKIMLFELRRKESSEQKWDFFLDRARKKNEFPKKSPNELPDSTDAYSLDRMNSALRLRWRGDDGAYEGPGGIGRIFQVIPCLMGVLWLFLLLVVSVMWIRGVSLYE